MPRIEDYALLGDLHTAVLVSREGSMDWCCFPRFDSPACFAALLGTPDHGRWLIAPDKECIETTRRYRGDTLILETEHRTEDGVVRVIDFMPVRDQAADIVRIVEGVEGTVTMESELKIRFDYGQVAPWVRRVDHTRLAVAGPDALCLRTSAEMHGEGMATRSTFTVTEGERVAFDLTWFPSHEDLPPKIDPYAALAASEQWWNEWSASSGGVGARDDVVCRSLLVLKALTYAPTGGIVAAPTTSLPEHIGGVRNWDYRFCWLRDASLTLVAMLKAGHKDEATAWRDWLLRAIAGDPQSLQIMYGIAGERRLEEYELPHLPGFANSQPVRIGNAASHQMQLDVFGEVIDALYLSLVHGSPPSHFASALMRHMLAWLENGWRLEDAGIWEVRGPLRHFTHSKLMAWVAFDRAVRLNEEFGMSGPVDDWRRTRDEIKEQILELGWNEEKQAFTQAYGLDELDASLLLMPIMGFLPPNDPRIVSTVDAIQRELSVDGLLNRYRTETEGVDGLPAGEGAFLACSFWLVEVMALQGRQEEAEELFDRLCGLQNDLGLLAEEYDPVAGQQLGNFPQAFSHLALITAALTLESRETR